MHKVLEKLELIGSTYYWIWNNSPMINYGMKYERETPSFSLMDAQIMTKLFEHIFLWHSAVCLTYSHQQQCEWGAQTQAQFYSAQVGNRQ